MNQRLDNFYNAVEATKPVAHINRIYFHAGYTIEEVIANLMGIMAQFADELGDFREEFDALYKRIYEIMQSFEPEIIAELIKYFEKAWPDISLDEVNEFLGGIPKLNGVLNGDDEMTFDSALAMPFVAELKLARNSAMQAIYHDPTSGQWYISQADGKSPEGFLINRVSASGKLLSNMWIKGGGHGVSLLWVPRPGSKPLGVYQYGGLFRYFEYQDDTTRDADDLFKSVDADNLLSFMPPHVTWGMPAFSENNEHTAGLFASQHYDGENISLSVSQGTFNQATNRFEFNGTGTTFNDKQWVNPNDNVLQGIAVTPVTDVNGKYLDKNFVIYVATSVPGLTGNSGVQRIQVFKYDYEANVITFWKTLEDMSNVVVPIYNQSNNNWQADYAEIEGLSRVIVDSGKKLDPALVFGISVNRTVKGRTAEPWKNYLFAFANPATNAMLTSAFTNGITNTPNVNGTAVNTLWRLTDGQYEISAQEMAQYVDAPFAWRGFNSNYDFTLENSLPNQHGDIIQKLTLRAVDYPTTTYTRVVNYNASGYGADYLPANIGTWAKDIREGVNAPRPTQVQINAGIYRKLSDIVEPGTFYIANALSASIDFEGINNALAGRGFLLVNHEGYNAGGATFQEVIPLGTAVEYQTYRITRWITGEPDQYGIGYSSITEKGAWDFTQSQRLSGWEKLDTVSSDFKLNGLHMGTSASVKIFQFTGVTGTGATSGKIADLPHKYLPTEIDTWGIPMLVQNDGDQFMASGTLNHTTGALYLSALPTGKAVDSKSKITFSATWAL